MASGRPAEVAVRAGGRNWLTAGLLRLVVLSGFIVGVGMLSPRLDPDEAWLVVGAGAAATAGGGIAFLVATRRLVARLPFLERSGEPERVDRWYKRSRGQSPHDLRSGPQTAPQQTAARGSRRGHGQSSRPLEAAAQAQPRPTRPDAGTASGALEDSARVTDAVLLELRRIGLPLLGLGFFLFWTFVYVALWAFHPDEAFKGLAKEPRFADFFYYAVSTAFTSPPEGIAAGSRGARSATMIELFTAVALLGAYVSSFVDWHRANDRRARPEDEHV